MSDQTTTTSSEQVPSQEEIVQKQEQEPQEEQIQKLVQSYVVYTISLKCNTHRDVSYEEM